MDKDEVPSSPASSTEKTMTNQPWSAGTRGVLLGSLSVFISILGAALTFPFLQSQRDLLECDALCYGSMQSARSALSLIGSVVVGRMSDQLGRFPVLYIGIASSLFSYGINYSSPTITAMWLSMLPSALNQNWSVLKALFADYNQAEGGSEKKRAADVGRLGMAVGVSFMVGPLLGATFLKSYSQATGCAIIMTMLSGLCIFWLPRLAEKSAAEVATSAEKEKEKEKPNPFVEFWNLPAARLPGSRLLFAMRFLMTLAYNIFMTIWTVSLKERFNFGPRDHAAFMGWIGLWYALSQGVLAQWFISKDPTRLLLVCIVSLSCGRMFAMLTDNIFIVYPLMAAVIVALGIMNTAMSSACSKLANKDQVGGLIGVAEAVESLAGLFGPTLGGLLYRINPQLPLLSVVGVYAIVFVLVSLYYKATIVDHHVDTDHKKDDDSALRVGLEGTKESVEVSSLKEDGSGSSSITSGSSSSSSSSSSTSSSSSSSRPRGEVRRMGLYGTAYLLVVVLAYYGPNWYAESVAARGTMAPPTTLGRRLATEGAGARGDGKEDAKVAEASLPPPSPPPAQNAHSFAPASLPQTHSFRAGNKHLSLRASGAKTALFVNIYTVGLYLGDKAMAAFKTAFSGSDGSAGLRDRRRAGLRALTHGREPLAFLLKIERRISVDKLTGPLMEALSEAASSSSKGGEYAQARHALEALLTNKGTRTHFNKADTIEFSFSSDRRVSVSVNREKDASVSGGASSELGSAVVEYFAGKGGPGVTSALSAQL